MKNLKNRESLIWCDDCIPQSLFQYIQIMQNYFSNVKTKFGQANLFENSK